MSETYTKELMSTFGANFRERRERMNISQCSLSRSTGLPQSLLSTVEAGRNMTLRTMAKLAEALGAEVSELLTKPRN